MPTPTYHPHPPTPPRAAPAPCAVCGKAPVHQQQRCVGCFSFRNVMGHDRNPATPALPFTTPVPRSIPAPTRTPTGPGPCANPVCDRTVPHVGRRCGACELYWRRHRGERPAELVQRGNAVRAGIERRRAVAA